MTISHRQMPVQTPDLSGPERFDDAVAAVDRLTELYTQACDFLRTHFTRVLETPLESTRVRAFYPEVRFRTSSYAQVDSRLSFGHVSSPGTFAATITRPDLFRNYLIQQLELLLKMLLSPEDIN